MTSEAPYYPYGVNPELDAVREEAANCQRCDLWTTRTQVVMGEGDPHAQLMMIGEGPGEDDDASGRPFSGRTGPMLERVLSEAGLARQEVYLTNIVRCRPTKVENARITNRSPRAGEAKACQHWRTLEIDLVDPRVIVCFGATSAKFLIDKNLRLTEQRGQIFHKDDGRLYIPTIHPAYVLRLLSVDRVAYHAAKDNLVNDLRQAKSLVQDSVSP